VEPTEEDSNEHLVRSHLLKDKAAAATFIGMKNFSLTDNPGVSLLGTIRNPNHAYHS
jgi:hypothetical protein